MMKNAYVSLAVQTIVSGIIMYLVMFVMIDRTTSFYNNLNMFYMTLMMVAPMVVLMIVAMRHVFPSKAANGTLIVASLSAFFRQLCAHPDADDNRRHAAPTLDDPGLFGRDPDVRAGQTQ